MSPIPRLKTYSGPVLLSYGFRPFFFLGAVYAGLAVLAWLPLFEGELELRTAFGPIDWHVHEMLYGYLPAVMTGFLLTAIPNWTGRLPLQGTPLLVLVLLWLAGRVAVTVSGDIGWLAAALIDVGFLVLVVAAVTREIIAGRNWRNLRVVAIVSLLLIGNIAFHLEAHFYGSAAYGLRIGVAAMVLMIMVIGGRIVPSFTRNWLVRENPGRLPAPLGTLDVSVIAFSTVALALWVAQPVGPDTAAALAAAGLANIVRLARWAGDRTWRDRLVLVLHVGYAFIPLGFLLASAAFFDLIAESAGVHAWTVGGGGTMTLAVMTRASLGHTGHALYASAFTQVIYAAIFAAALTRIGASLFPAWSFPLLHITALAWCTAFFGFALSYGPTLVGTRRAIAAQ
ncbi:MAG: NnrS family protein [Pseudolabrys sp.]|nr:NnrS family protein [Pseudolabrys sp.]